ncbi:hypothetical protein THAOC_14303 [Thalassiosira oceanica]|uniref:Uncharacterized protein n=1 Tax=Thalassiosira oceanica TaxID=159749 RepID=K0SIV5_THAOC|nr:hypothetical protein THAOC_14303 [Thalassiosira oceanica]|eukprot:EJK64909.1 hypothetical protein THAOC_14303 [Thalassiosira oceanica]
MSAASKTEYLLQRAAAFQRPIDGSDESDGPARCTSVSLKKSGLLAQHIVRSSSPSAIDPAAPGADPTQGTASIVPSTAREDKGIQGDAEKRRDRADDVYQSWQLMISKLLEESLSPC